MKTLDEVIKAFSEVNKEVGCGDCQFNDAESDDIPCELNDCIFNDALHYLKEYQKVDSHYWSEKAISELNNIADAYFLQAYRKEQHENVPLTWDELKLMEGFPVWVEGNHGPALSYKGWALISFDRQGDDMKCQLYNSSEFWIGKEDYGTDWQAYMKERLATGGILTCEPKLKKIGDDTEIKWRENE